MNRSPQFLIPLEVQQHTVADDPLVKTYVQPEKGTDEPQPFQPLPPFWTQPVKLPPSAYDLPSRRKAKNKTGGNFRAKGKFPLPGKKKKTKVVRVLKTPNVSDPLVKKPSVSGDVPASADPTWKPATHKKVLVPAATRTLRPRDPDRGIVLPGRP